jgi:hypothetical protein
MLYPLSAGKPRALGPVRHLAERIFHESFLKYRFLGLCPALEQRAVVDELTKIVRGREQFQKADASERLIKISTSDGMALVFYTSPEAPVRCAMLGRSVRKNTPSLD